MVKLIALDNGIKERFAIIGDEGLDKSSKKWSWLVGECSGLIPGFEGEYTTIDSPFGFLEQIYLGKLIKDLPPKHKALIAEYFPKPEVLFHVLERFQGSALKDLTNADKVLDEAVHFLSREVLVTMDALKHLFLQIVDRKKLIKKSVAWSKEHSCHPHASSVSTKLKDREMLLRKGDKGFGFEMLVRHLAWHVLMSHEWLMNANLENVPFPAVCQFEQDIALRILYSYLMQMEEGANLSAARLFSRLERLRGPNGFPQSKEEWSLRPNPFRWKDRDLLDGDLAEFLVTGFMYKGKRHPLIGLTCDRQKLRERLTAIIRGIKYVNKLLDGMEQKGESPHRVPARIPICPGIMIVVDQYREKPTEKVDVQQLIEEIDAENTVNPPELQISQP
jgi:hypothetical protein